MTQGGGNTMVFNEAACRLLAKTFVRTEVVAHDWWAYIIIMGAGGRVFYDANPCLRYRQHGQNLIGSNVGWSARMVRVRKLFEGRLKDWNETNIRALEQHIECLTPENRKILYDYARARQSALPRRLLEVRRLVCTGKHCWATWACYWPLSSRKYSKRVSFFMGAST